MKIQPASYHIRMSSFSIISNFNDSTYKVEFTDNSTYIPLRFTLCQSATEQIKNLLTIYLHELRNYRKCDSSLSIDLSYKICDCTEVRFNRETRILLIHHNNIDEYYLTLSQIKQLICDIISTIAALEKYQVESKF